MADCQERQMKQRGTVISAWISLMDDKLLPGFFCHWPHLFPTESGSDIIPGRISLAWRRLCF